MKIRSLLVLTAFVTSIAHAQTVPNAGFESWTGSTADSWQNNNVSAGVTLVSKTTTGAEIHSGSSAIKVTSNGSTTGILTTGRIGTPISGGAPIHARPIALEGWYKYTTSGNDSALVQIYTYAAGTATSTPSTSTCYARTTLGATGGWAHFYVPITFLNSATPDTIKINIFSSANVPVAGSALILDDLTYSLTTSVDEISSVESLLLYPNPASGNENVTILLPTSVETGNEIELRVFDVMGRTVLTQKNQINSSSALIDFSTSSLQNGLYFCQVYNGGKVIGNSKLIVN